MRVTHGACCWTHPSLRTNVWLLALTLYVWSHDAAAMRITDDTIKRSVVGSRPRPLPQPLLQPLPQPRPPDDAAEANGTTKISGRLQRGGKRKSSGFSKYFPLGSVAPTSDWSCRNESIELCRSRGADCVKDDGDDHVVCMCGWFDLCLDFNLNCSGKLSSADREQCKQRLHAEGYVSCPKSQHVTNPYKGFRSKCTECRCSIPPVVMKTCQKDTGLLCGWRAPPWGSPVCKGQGAQKCVNGHCICQGKTPCSAKGKCWPPEYAPLQASDTIGSCLSTVGKWAAKLGAKFGKSEGAKKILDTWSQKGCMASNVFGERFGGIAKTIDVDTVNWCQSELEFCTFGIQNILGAIQFAGAKLPSVSRTFTQYPLQSLRYLREVLVPNLLEWEKQGSSYVPTMPADALENLDTMLTAMLGFPHFDLFQIAEGKATEVFMQRLACRAPRLLRWPQSTKMHDSEVQLDRYLSPEDREKHDQRVFSFTSLLDRTWTLVAESGGSARHTDTDLDESVHIDLPAALAKINAIDKQLFEALRAVNASTSKEFLEYCDGAVLSDDAVSGVSGRAQKVGRCFVARNLHASSACKLVKGGMFKKGFTQETCEQKMWELEGDTFNYKDDTKKTALTDRGGECWVKRCGSDNLRWRKKYGEFEVFSLYCQETPLEVEEVYRTTTSPTLAPTLKAEEEIESDPETASGEEDDAPTVDTSSAMDADQAPSLCKALKPIDADIKTGSCLCCFENLLSDNVKFDWKDRQEDVVVQCLQIGLNSGESMNESQCATTCERQVHCPSYTQSRYRWSLFAKSSHCFGQRVRKKGHFFEYQCKDTQTTNYTQKSHRAVLKAISGERSCPALKPLQNSTAVGECLCCNNLSSSPHGLYERSSLVNSCLSGFKPVATPDAFDATDCKRWCTEHSEDCSQPTRKMYTEGYFSPKSSCLARGSWTRPCIADTVFEEASEKSKAIVAQIDRVEGVQTVDELEKAPDPPGDGCAAYDSDIYKPTDGDTCFIRVYKCSNDPVDDPSNHNTGDIAWALTRSCYAYGKYLHIFKIKVAKALFTKGVPYSKCNGGKLGRHCGCGLDGTKCGKDPELKKKAANNFGFRVENAGYYAHNHYFDWMKKVVKETNGTSIAGSCPCYQFSLPSRAEAPHGKDIDVVRSQQFVERKDYNRIPIDFPVQWTFVSRERIIDIKKCFGKHVWVKDQTTEDAVERFKKAVLSRWYKTECGEVDFSKMGLMVA